MKDYDMKGSISTLLTSSILAIFFALFSGFWLISALVIGGWGEAVASGVAAALAWTLSKEAKVIHTELKSREEKWTK